MTAKGLGGDKQNQLYGDRGVTLAGERVLTVHLIYLLKEMPVYLCCCRFALFFNQHEPLPLISFCT